MVKNPTTEENSGEEDSQVNSKNTSGDQIPTETPTLDPAFERTATVAVQLTKVSEFQQEVTKEP